MTRVNLPVVVIYFISNLHCCIAASFTELQSSPTYSYQGRKGGYPNYLRFTGRVDPGQADLPQGYQGRQRDRQPSALTVTPMGN